jgi:hypothetical protein
VLLRQRGALGVIFFFDGDHPPVDFAQPRTSPKCETLKRPRSKLIGATQNEHPMTKNFSQMIKNPLSQSPNSRYNLLVENYAKAPHRRLFPFVAVSGRADTPFKSLIRFDLHTLVFRRKTSPSLSVTSTHFTKHRGYTPILPILELGANARRVTAPVATLISPAPRSVPQIAVSILTCNKKAICSTLSGNAPATNAVYVVIPSTSINPQETDR